MTTRDKIIVTIGSVLVAVLILALTLAVEHRIASRQQKRAEYAYPQGRVDKWTATDWGNWKMTHYDHPLASEDGPGSHEDDRLTECGVRAEYDRRARVVRGR